MDEELRIISLTQPWATLVAIGAKRIETRSWATPYRGAVAIHAAQSLGPVGGWPGLWARCAEPAFFRALEPHFRVTHRRVGTTRPTLTDCIDVTELPRGAIVAVARLTSIGGTDFLTSHHNSTVLLTEQERAFGDYSPGRYAWLLADVRQLVEPLPYCGAQGLRRLPGEVVGEVWRRAA